jgi:hypothetical protein
MTEPPTVNLVNSVNLLIHRDAEHKHTRPPPTLHSANEVAQTFTSFTPFQMPSHDHAEKARQEWSYEGGEATEEGRSSKPEGGGWGRGLARPRLGGGRLLGDEVQNVRGELAALEDPEVAFPRVDLEGAVGDEPGGHLDEGKREEEVLVAVDEKHRRFDLSQNRQGVAPAD